MSNKKYLEKETPINAPLINGEGIHRDIGSSLIIAPHPDDESLGCGGMIALLRQKDVAVYVVFVTSGSASHPNSKEFPPERLAKVREDEAVEACKILGVKKSNVIFLKEQDAGLPNMDKDYKLKLQEKIAALITKNSIQTVFIPWRRDKHGDHEAASAISIDAALSLPKSPQIVEYPIWLWKQGNPSDWPIEDEVHPFRLYINEVRDLKSKAIYAHKSQTTHMIIDDPEGFILTHDLLTPFMGDYEYYFFKPETESSTLQRDYFDQLYSNNEDPWKFASSDYEKSKYEKSISVLNKEKFESGFEIGCSIGVFTKMLAKKCNKLLAVDISPIPLEEARKRCKDLPQVTFETLDISKNFPQQSFDLITLCEVGYYLNESALIDLFHKIDDHLEAGGSFLMVHWTSYVSDYPLTGSQVHRIFKKHFEKNDLYNLIKKYDHESYELFLWQKNA
tara:strand:- start:315 stop:1661 length:1347 start_codon:yes stop_codon:yes gene_type:complete